MSRYTDEDAQRALDFEAAEKRMAQIRVDRLDQALRLGARNVAETLDSPELRESIAKQALLEQYLQPAGPARPKGPARRAKPKVDARKRQRQARKANR